MTIKCKQNVPYASYNQGWIKCLLLRELTNSHNLYCAFMYIRTYFPTKHRHFLRKNFTKYIFVHTCRSYFELCSLILLWSLCQHTYTNSANSKKSLLVIFFFFKCKEVDIWPLLYSETKARKVFHIQKRNQEMCSHIYQSSEKQVCCLKSETKLKRG